MILFATGTVFYSLVEGWSVLNSLWFSVMTLLTVGFGDLVPTTAAGKVFTMLYVLVGAGVLLGFIPIFARETMDLRTGRNRAPKT